MNQIRNVSKSVTSSNRVFTRGMKPPTEVYPLFFAVGVGLTASAIVGYSTLTRDGSDVLVNKTNKRYYWDSMRQAPRPKIVSRNPFSRNNTR